MIHYSEGYLVDPGYLDLSDIRFIVSKADEKETNDITIIDETLDDDFDDGEGGIVDDYYMDDDDAGKKRRQLASLDSYYVDIAFFHEPPKCSKSKEGCNWPDLGVGYSDAIGDLLWCCTETEVDSKICREEHLGRLMIDKSKFGGEHRSVEIPKYGDATLKINDPKLITEQGTGKYSIVMANCYDYGREATVEGDYVWHSKDGFLPGHKFGEYRYLIIFMVFYAVLICWYGILMVKNKDAVIEIQRWILWTTGLGLAEMFFNVVDFYFWNLSGRRVSFVMYIWILIGTFKRAISRCVLLMVSLGWGVVRDTLGDDINKIITAGTIYALLSFTQNVTEIIMVKEFEHISLEKEEEIYDVWEIVSFIVAAINVLFYMWILDSLNGTMQYLENMGQTMKLKRYLKLRLILLISILFAITWSVFSIVNATMDTALLEYGQEWAVESAAEAIYFFILVGIAVLWKPDPNAKEFAFVMELPSIGDDMVLDTNIGTVDDDDDDEDRDGVKVSGTGLKIDDGVAS